MVEISYGVFMITTFDQVKPGEKCYLADIDGPDIVKAKTNQKGHWGHFRMKQRRRGRVIYFRMRCWPDPNEAVVVVKN